jgi:hypothetical protein
VRQCPDDGGVGVNLRKAFERYDADHNGHIDKREFEGLLRDLGVSTEPWKVNDAFRAVDTDGSNKITFDEFARCAALRCAALHCTGWSASSWVWN